MEDKSTPVIRPKGKPFWEPQSRQSWGRHWNDEDFELDRVHGKAERALYWAWLDLQAAEASNRELVEGHRLEIMEQQAVNLAIRMQRDELSAWKASQMAVESSWDAQAVGREIEVPLGASIRPAILPAILALKDQVRALEIVDVHNIKVLRCGN